MKTITQFSTLEIKHAAAARAALVEKGTPPEQIAEALGPEVGMKGERLLRLVECLEAVGERVDRVRMVRVFAGEDEPRGARKIGEHFYLLDEIPTPQRDEGRGRGREGQDRRGGFGGRGPGGPGGRGPGGRGGRGSRPEGEARFAEDRGPRGQGGTPSAGVGWTLTREPVPPGERRGPPRRGHGRGPR
jgi:hypothetical protein